MQNFLGCVLLGGGNGVSQLVQDFLLSAGEEYPPPANPPLQPLGQCRLPLNMLRQFSGSQAMPLAVAIFLTAGRLQSPGFYIAFSDSVLFNRRSIH